MSNNSITLTDALGHPVSFTYDADNRGLTVTDALGHTSYSEFDGSGNLVAWRDPRSSDPTDPRYRTTLSYNPLGKLASVQDPLGREQTSIYDAAGNLARIMRVDGRQVAYSYDAANRLSQVQTPSESRTIAYGRNANGVITSVTDNVGGNYTYQVDALGRPTSITSPSGTMTATWDEAGRMTSLTLGGVTRYYYYYPTGELRTITGSSITYAYDAEGRLFQTLKKCLYGGWTVRRDIERLSNGWIRAIRDRGNPAGADLLYEYDAAGNVSRYTQSGSSESFAYDDAGRLIAWVDPSGLTHSYGYDPAGNLTGKDGLVFVLDAAIQITNPGYSYDANGNLTSDGTLTYSYDTLGRLVEVRRASDGSFVASYVYDYRGLRVGKTTPSGTTTYLWDLQGHLYRESGPNGVREYFWDGNGGLARVDCTPQGGQKTILYSHLNARGDVLSLWDDTLAHNIFATYRYGPWGETLSAEGSMAGQPIRYASYYYDDETGLYYLKGRYYSPRLGRFLTKDPATWAPHYTYGANNPVRSVDPSGLAASDTVEGTAQDNPDWEADLARLLALIGSDDPEVAVYILTLIAMGVICLPAALVGGTVAAMAVVGSTGWVLFAESEMISTIEVVQENMPVGEYLVRQAVALVGLATGVKYMPKP